MSAVPTHRPALGIEIVGVGALGGSILVCLAKLALAAAIRIWDFDVCRERNLPHQWFRMTDCALNVPKVTAVATMTRWVSGKKIQRVPERFTGAEEEPLGPVVILAVDSLAERQRIWRNLASRHDVELVLDARMGANVVEIHAVKVLEDDPGPYEESLAAEPYRGPCALASATYALFGGASIVASLLTRYARGEPFSRRIVFDFDHFLMETEPPDPVRG